MYYIKKGNSLSLLFRYRKENKIEGIRDRGREKQQECVCERERFKGNVILQGGGGGPRNRLRNGRFYGVSDRFKMVRQ